MSKSIVANRIYLRQALGSDAEGRICEEDFQEMAPDLVLLRGMKPSTTSTTGGGVRLARTIADGLHDEAGVVERVKHPVRACAIFEIVRMPSVMSKGNPMELQVGDFVHCRNSVVDPLLGNELATTDLYLGIIGLAERPPKRETTVDEIVDMAVFEARKAVGP